MSSKTATSSTGRHHLQDPTRTTKIQDVTSGLPGVAELFEARDANDYALIAEIAGEDSFGQDTNGKRKVVITPSATTGALNEYRI